ncbi:MAG TPA: hypothetical protein VIV11_41990 [Kofleriaceae bacterium]
MRIALILLVLAAIGCADDESVSVATGERVVERRIDGDSPFWSAAPYLFEGPFTCPLPQEVFVQLAVAHESFAIHNVGAATSLEIRLEGESYDAALSAEPLLLVYAGAEVPDQRSDAANCFAIDKPGGGQAASISIPVASGDVVTAIALEYEIGPGLDGSGSGTFRLRVIPTL